MGISDGFFYFKVCAVAVNTIVSAIVFAVVAGTVVSAVVSAIDGATQAGMKCGCCPVAGSLEWMGI